MKLSSPCFGLVLTLFYLSSTVEATGTCTHNVKKGPILAALLDLHTDEQCSVVNIKGLQQLAALEATLKEINIELKQEGLEIFLQVFDSCSSSRIALTSTLKALVSAKQTCLSPPLFLGFIGPENMDSLSAIQNLTKVFNIPHVIPYSVNRKKGDDRIFSLTDFPVTKHSEAAIILMSKLGWKTATIIYEESPQARAEANDLATSIADNNTVCLGNNVFRFNSTSSFKEALNRRDDTDGIIVLLDTIEWAHSVLKKLENVTSQVILSVSKTGLPSWSMPSSSNQTVFLLQLISGSPVGDLSKTYDAYLVKVNKEHQLEEFKKLCRQYGSSECDDSMIINSLENNQDWTVNLMQSGLMLFSSALRIAHLTKCKPTTTLTVKVHYKPGVCSSLGAIPMSEWNDLLGKASVFVKSSESSVANRKISFGMEVPPSFNVYTTHKFDKLQKVGWITNKTFFSAAPDYTFPLLSTVRPLPTECNQNFPAEEDETSWIDQDSFEFITNLFSIDSDLWDTVTMITGLAISVLIIMFLVIFVVYKSFKVNTERRTYTNSSMSPRGSIDSR